MSNKIKLKNMKRQYLILIIVITFISVAFIQQPTMQLKKVPKALPKMDTSFTELNWQIIVKSHYDIFVDTDYFVDRAEITVAFWGSVWGWFYSHNNYQDNYHPLKGSFLQPSFYNRIVKPFYKSFKQQKALYKWVKPLYLDGFKKLPEKKKNVYIQMLNHAKKYLTEFNYNAELELFNKRDKGSNWERIGPQGMREYDFRRLEWFIFRRVKNGDLTIKEMLYWVDILQKDIEQIK